MLLPIRPSILKQLHGALFVGIVCGLFWPVLPLHAQSGAETEASGTLRVVTKEIEPFVFAEDPLTGFSIELWDELARAGGIEYEYVIVDTVTEQLNAVATGDADVAMAAISITEAREEAVDFSFPYFDAGLGILVRTSNQSPVFAMLRSGELFVPLLRILGLLLLVIVIAGHLIWLLERRRNPDFPASYVAGVWEGIWWAAVTVTTVGYGDRTPHSIFGRFFGLLWMFAGLFIIANFTAGVTTRLTIQQIQGAINGPQDLAGKAVATVEGSTADVWLTEQHLPHLKVTTAEEAYALLENATVEAVVYDYPVLRYHALSFGDGRIQVVGMPFNEEHYGMAFAQDSPLREEINRTLLQLRENGTYDRIHREWFGN